MSTRVSPVERGRADIDTLFASERELGDVLEEVARLGVRLLLQTAIEAEVTEFLGRERYAHGDRARPGSRNGHCPTTIKTTTGPITIERPKLRGTDEAFASRLLGIGVCRTNALESLVIAGFVRGLSVRDVEATLAEALGPEAALSKSTVSRVCEAIKDEFDAWKKRDLTDVAPRVPVPRRQPLPLPRRGPGRAGAGRVGHHHRGTTGAGGPGERILGVHRRLEGLPREHGRPGTAGPAAGHLRRRPRPHRRCRAGLRRQPAPEMSDPPGQKYPGQGARGAPGGGEEGVLGRLRRHQ